SLRDRPQRFTLDLGRAVTPTRVELLLRTHQSPVFAPFTLETSEDGTDWTAVACPWRPADDLRAFAARPAATRIAVTCDFPLLRHLRIVQTPASFRLYWELAEIDVFLASPPPPYASRAAELPRDGGA